MTGCALNPAIVERHDDGGLPAATLAALEREAAHLTRRDGRRRLVVRCGSEPPTIEDANYEEAGGPIVLASIDIA